MTVSPTYSVPNMIARLYAMICAVLLISCAVWLDGFISALQYTVFDFLERSLLGADKA